MDIRAVFGLSILFSFIASGLVAWIYVWPRLRELSRDVALSILIIPHTFRFIGLSFLVVGVVSPKLPSAFATPAAFGDLVAMILAIASVIVLYNRISWATYLIWIFNIWGALDFLVAFYEGITGLPDGPGSFGAAFYIPTVVVPALFVTHLMIFRLLLRPKQ
ncbi:MAG TPA: hypothetical protein VGQ55_17395 [Pyrinomonadaceae bacterium]|jgi:hypothetical protein|nr:hypothetical protein [Pyrinomonadaceae bacterium]